MVRGYRKAGWRFYRYNTNNPKSKLETRKGRKEKEKGNVESSEYQLRNKGREKEGFIFIGKLGLRFCCGTEYTPEGKRGRSREVKAAGKEGFVVREGRDKGR